MNRWFLLGASAICAGMSAQAAFAAHATRTTGTAVSMAAAAANRPLTEPANLDVSMSGIARPLNRRTTSPQLVKPASINNGLRFQRLQPAGILDTHSDSVLHRPTFIWAGKEAGQGLDFVVYRHGKGAKTYAESYLKEFAGHLDITPAAVDEARLVFLHDDGKGPVIARYQQVVDGYDVVNRQLNVIMGQDLHLIAISGYFAPAKGAAPKMAVSAFRTGPQPAINTAFKDLGLPASAYSLHQIPDHSAGYTRFAPQQGAHQAAAVQLSAPVGAKQVLFPVGGKLVPGWLMTIQAARAASQEGIGYAYVASADGSRILFRKNLVNRAAYTYRVFADVTTGKPDDSPFGNGLMPFPGPAYTETFGTGTLVTITSGTQGITDPWLPIPAGGGFNQFPSYQTIGNNVWAYLDVAGGNGRDNPADIAATTTSPNSFDYTIDFSKSPAEHNNQEAAIVSLFYIDNWLHDAWYNAGFTEAAGNAQYVNYGRGGVAGDPILAETQDNSGRNNSNMATPPDGYSPTQQMFLWDGPIISQTDEATSTGSATYTFDPALPASFSEHEYDVTAPVAIYDDGDASGTGMAGQYDACQPTSQDLAGKIALIADIYTCEFSVKVKNAQDAGAVGALVVYNGASNPDEAYSMGGSDSTVTIPVVGVSDDDANPVIADINSGNTVTLHMQIDYKPDRDGSLDAQVVAHEFFHYVSNRLVGNALGLSNVQGGGMGEGWSDMAALLLTARPDDLANSPNGYYSMGGYVTDNFIYGVRSLAGVPYTTDMSVNPLTFKWIGQGTEVHFVGTVWASMLWEAYVGLYKHYASIDPATAYETAKTKMMNYLIEGLMGTPNAPTMVEARDAILAAAKATSSDDYNIFVTAFAKRGLGFGAIAPPRNSTTLAGGKESYSTDAKAFIVQGANLDVNVEGVCDADYSLDAGETGRIKVTLLNMGSSDLTGITAQFDSKSDITFANGGKVAFDKLDMLGGTVTATTTATVNSASKTSEVMTINVSFPDVGETEDAVTEPQSIEFQFTSNQDFKATSSVDDVENIFANLYDWTRTLTGDGAGWNIDSYYNDALHLSPDNHYWYVPDNASPSSAALITPSIMVGDGPFSVSFYHYYQFEPGGYDGGVVEISTDGGATWQDVTEAGGAFRFGYSGKIGPYNEAIEPGRPAFVNIGGTAIDGAREMVNFGTALAGKTVQLRFRIGSDPAGGQVGWIIDDVTVKGAAAPMFSTVVREDRYCGGRVPVADAGPDQNAKAGDRVTLDGSTSSDAEGAVTYQWSQTAGEEVTLLQATSAKPSFTTPFGPGTYTFKLTVTDLGAQVASDTVAVTAADSPPTANAGSNQSVDAGETVLLDGTASTDSESALTYAWKQTGGASVKLVGADSATPSFAAPDSSTELTFELTVTDKGNQTDSSEVTVSVQAVPESRTQAPPSGDNGGGGAAGLLMLFGLLGLARRRWG